LFGQDLNRKRSKTTEKWTQGVFAAVELKLLRGKEENPLEEPPGEVGGGGGRATVGGAEPSTQKSDPRQKGPTWQDRKKKKDRFVKSEQTASLFQRRGPEQEQSESLGDSLTGGFEEKGVTSKRKETEISRKKKTRSCEEKIPRGEVFKKMYVPP